MANEKGLTVLARAKRWAKQLKGGEDTYIDEKRKNEMDVARLIKDYNARQAKKKPAKSKAAPKAESKPEVKEFETVRTGATESGLRKGGLTEKEITKLRKK